MASGGGNLPDPVSSFVELYAALLHVYGRTMRPPFTVRHLAIALAALGKGFALQAMAGEEHPVVSWAADDGDRRPDWTLFGVVIQALVEAVTVPTDVQATGVEPPEVEVTEVAATDAQTPG